MDCKLNIPYPEIKVEKQNLYYANLLLEDYAGMFGELSAITEYIYQKNQKFQENEKFSQTMSNIAIVEMKHLDILGKLIKLLGLNPKFKFKNKNCYEFWNSSFLDYDTNIINMLKNNILMEQRAINNYRLRIKMIDDKYIKKILERIILDEEEHIKCFNYLLNQEYFNC